MNPIIPDQIRRAEAAKAAQAEAALNAAPAVPISEEVKLLRSINDKLTFFVYFAIISAGLALLAALIR